MPQTPPKIIAPAAAHPTPVGGGYVRNLSALFHHDPKLALAIEAVHPDDVPPIETARDGAPTVRVTTAAGKHLYLHSRYRPLQEAQAWAQSVKADDRYVVIVSGFGLGHHVRTLFDRLPEDALLLVAEPDLGLLKAALAATDLADALASGRLLIFTDLDRGGLVDRLEPRSVLFTAGAGTLFAAHPASLQADSAGFHAAFQKLITEFVSFTRTGFLTLMLNNVATCRNVANNLGRYATTAPLDLLHNAYANLPAVLVAAGPSLQKNMHLLYELLSDEEFERARRHHPHLEARTSKQPTRRAVIIAVQTMLKPLLAAGIEPDFVTSLDYNTVSTRFFENLEESGPTSRVHLVAEAKANWNVLDTFNGTMSLLHNEFAARLLRDATPPRAGLKAGATVAHLSFYLAEYLGCNPIILTGQDLGFQTGDAVTYDPGDGTGIGGLDTGTIYYVIRVDSTHVKLASSYDDAESGTAVHITPGSGESHRLIGTNQAQVPNDSSPRFNPATDVSGNTINLPYDLSLSTGDPVVYGSGGGAAIGGLTDGATYYVISKGGNS